MIDALDIVADVVVDALLTPYPWWAVYTAVVWAAIYACARAEAGRPIDWAGGWALVTALPEALGGVLAARWDGRPSHPPDLST